MVNHFDLNTFKFIVSSSVVKIAKQIITQLNFIESTEVQTILL